MNGRDIIDLIDSRRLNLFNFSVSFTDGYTLFPNIRGFSIMDISKSNEGDLIVTGVGDEDTLGIRGNEIIDHITSKSLGASKSIFILPDSNKTLSSRSFEVIGLSDIGYSNNIVTLDTKEIIVN